ncbi:RNA polymerase sigma factor [candidate division KSB1 bacterium]
MTEELTDRELVKRALDGNAGAAAELARRHEKKAFYITYGFTHNREEARDLVQEAFLRMFRNLKLYRAKYEFGTWFYRIVTNLCINYNRRKKIIRWTPLHDFVGGLQSPDDDIVEEIDRRQKVSKLKQAISMLPEKQKAAILLFDIEGFSIRDSARILRCSEGTVMSRLHYGRKRLKTLFLEAGIQDFHPSADSGGEA